MNTITLNMNMFMSNTGFTRRNTIIHNIVAASQEYVNIYSTCRLTGSPPLSYFCAQARPTWCVDR